MIDNLTNNPRRREPLHTQWWVPTKQEFENPQNWIYKCPVTKFNVVQMTQFKKFVNLVFPPNGYLFNVLKEIPYIALDNTLKYGPRIAASTKPFNYNGTVDSEGFEFWLDSHLDEDKEKEALALAEKFRANLIPNVFYKNPFFKWEA